MRVLNSSLLPHNDEFSLYKAASTVGHFIPFKANCYLKLPMKKKKKSDNLKVICWSACSSGISY